MFGLHFSRSKSQSAKPQLESKGGSTHRLTLHASLAVLLFASFVLSACGPAPTAAPAAPTVAEAEAAPTEAPVEATEEPTAEVEEEATEEVTEEATEAVTETAETEDVAVDLSGVKSFLVDQSIALKAATAELKVQADAYYELAEAVDFDYAALWESDSASVIGVLEAARVAWIEAAPLYEQMEGVVAGTPSLASYDVILDAGASGADDPEGAVPFDLTLPDGRVLEKPGNLFGVTESTLWGTDPQYAIVDVEADWNSDGSIEFGETLPDANVLKSAADAMDGYAGDLLASGEAWEPTLSDAFTALVVMIPTMNEYFGSWRDSRFVLGEESTQRDFAVISRLADIQDILGGLELVYAQVLPLVESVDPDQAAQIGTDLTSLREYVAGIYAEEQGGKQFTPEEADLLGVEAQDRATSITGRIAQIAAQLGIEIEE